MGFFIIWRVGREGIGKGDLEVVIREVGRKLSKCVVFWKLRGESV